jgi:hypothetical protein
MTNLNHARQIKVMQITDDDTPNKPQGHDVGLRHKDVT